MQLKPEKNNIFTTIHICVDVAYDDHIRSQPDLNKSAQKQIFQICSCVREKENRDRTKTEIQNTEFSTFSPCSLCGYQGNLQARGATSHVFATVPRWSAAFSFQSMAKCKSITVNCTVISGANHGSGTRLAANCVGRSRTKY